MEEFNVLGKSIKRKEGSLKVTGKARYANDYDQDKILYIWLVTSSYAHAKIKCTDIKEAAKAPGVRAVLIGKDGFNPISADVLDMKRLKKK